MFDPAAPTSLVVNGVPRPLAPGPDRSLLFILRDELGLTGAKPGCGEGECGACTVLLDGEPVTACQVHLSEVVGRAVRTVEGLAAGGLLHPVQQAFLEVGAFQCGYCTAGMMMSAVALLEREPDPDDAQVREALHRATSAAAARTRGSCARCVGPPSWPVRKPGRVRAGIAAPTPPPVAIADERATDDWRPRRPWDLHAGRRARLVRRAAARPGRRSTSRRLRGRRVDDERRRLAPRRRRRRRRPRSPARSTSGQDNRTALSMLVADELRVPLSAVRLVMGDTDLCPYDVGTFGSRSMPDAGELLRRAAAGARALAGAARGRPVRRRSPPRSPRRTAPSVTPQAAAPSRTASSCAGMRRVETIDAGRRTRPVARPSAWPGAPRSA